MNMSRILLGTALALIVHTSTAFALIDVQLLGGKRWADFTGESGDSGASAMETTFAAHLDPIPLVPVAFGVTASHHAWNKDDFDVKGVSGYQVGLEVMGWVPIPFLATPYLKLNYSPMSVLKIDADDDISYALKGSGSGASVGAMFSFLPLVKLLFEVGMYDTKFEADDISPASFKDTLEAEGISLDADAKSKHMSLGVQVGF